MRKNMAGVSRRVIYGRLQVVTQRWMADPITQDEVVVETSPSLLGELVWAARVRLRSWQEEGKSFRVPSHACTFAF